MILIFLVLLLLLRSDALALKTSSSHNASNEYWFYIDASRSNGFVRGNIIQDFSSNQLHLEISGTYSFDNGSTSNGVKAFNFEDAYSYSNLFTPSPPISNRTLSLWINLIDNSSTGWGFGLVRYSTDNFECIDWNEFQVLTPESDEGGWCFGSSNFARSGGFKMGGKGINGIWTMITATYSTDSYIMYQNGIPVIRINDSTLLQTWTWEDVQITLGKRTALPHSNGWVNNLKGKVGEAAIWNRILTAEEIQNLYLTTRVKYDVQVPSYMNTTPNLFLLSVPLQYSTSCIRTANISGRLLAEITNIVISNDHSVIVEGRFQASNVVQVLNSHLLKVRWFVGRSSYRQTLFLNSTEISYPSNPSYMIQFRATFPNFFPASADFSGYLRTKVVLTNWPLRKKAICLRWKRKA